MSHTGRDYRQVNRRWLSPGAIIPHWAADIYFLSFLWHEDPHGTPFGVAGFSPRAVADPVAMTITWTLDLDPPGTGQCKLVQQIFTGTPRVDMTIRVDRTTGGFCEHVYTRPTPFDYVAIHLHDGAERARTFAAPFNGTLQLDASAKRYF